MITDEQVAELRRLIGGSGNVVVLTKVQASALLDERDALRAEVERLTRQRDDALADALASMSAAASKSAEAGRLRRVVEAARKLLGWKMESAYEHLTKEEADLRRAMVEAWEPT